MKGALKVAVGCYAHAAKKKPTEVKQTNTHTSCSLGAAIFDVQ
jgi:hypothetical protein